MRHLNTEILARIADGPATEEEAAHLDACAECRAELEALERQRAAVESLPPPPLPAEIRARVEAAVLDETARKPATSATRPYGRRALQTAAAVALFVAGGVVGASLDEANVTVAEREPVAGERPAVERSPATIASTESASTTPLENATPTDPRSSDEALDERPMDAALPVEVARETVDGSTPRASERLLADPEAALREAESRYLEAFARYVEDRGESIGADPTNRLAALEGILYTTRAALEASPEDPVLEGFYRSALVQREAMLNDVTITTAHAVY